MGEKGGRWRGEGVTEFDRTMPSRLKKKAKTFRKAELKKGNGGGREVKKNGIVGGRESWKLHTKKRLKRGRRKKGRNYNLPTRCNGMNGVIGP